MQGITLSNVQNNPLPLPPIAGQQRIVTLIESLFADLDEAKEKLTSVVEGFALRKAAILHRAFTGKLTAKWREENGIGKDSWKETSSSEIFEYITSGSRGWAQYYSDRGAIAIGRFCRRQNLPIGVIMRTTLRK